MRLGRGRGAGQRGAGRRARDSLTISMLNVLARDRLINASALVHYEQALAIAPNDAVAMRRVFQVMGWGARPQGYLQHQRDLRTRLAPLGRGPARRDSLLFVADSFATRCRVRAPSRKCCTTSRLPLPPSGWPCWCIRTTQAWYDLGETLYHVPPPYRGSAQASLAAFERSIAADSGFAPATSMRWRWRFSRVTAPTQRPSRVLPSGPGPAPMAHP